VVMSTTTIDNKVKRVVSNIRNLPTPPIVFHQIQKVINDPNVNASQIATILAEDPAMSVKVLKLTNSAFYGLSREIDSVKQAVIVVGVEAIKNLVLSASVLDMFKGNDTDQEYQDRFWRHSLATAFCCRLLARKVKARGIADPDAAFSAGLLHDVGKMIVCCFLPEEQAQFQQARAADRECADHEVEQQLFGYTHADIGGFLAAHWKIPQKLANAITNHHAPWQVDAEDSVSYIVYLGNYLAKKTFYDKQERYLVGTVEPHILERLQLSQSDLEGYSEALRDEYLKAETFMQMAGIGQ